MEDQQNLNFPHVYQLSGLAKVWKFSRCLVFKQTIDSKLYNDIMNILYAFLYKYK